MSLLLRLRLCLLVVRTVLVCAVMPDLDTVERRGIARSGGAVRVGSHVFFPFLGLKFFSKEKVAGQLDTSRPLQRNQDSSHPEEHMVKSLVHRVLTRPDVLTQIRPELVELGLPDHLRKPLQCGAPVCPVMA